MTERASPARDLSAPGVAPATRGADSSLASPAVDRRFWYAVEAIHDVVYFAPEAATVYADIGLKGWWMGYFASRAAALGPVGPAPVTALFHGFAPSMVARALPDAWS